MFLIKSTHKHTHARTYRRSCMGYIFSSSDKTQDIGVKCTDNIGYYWSGIHQEGLKPTYRNNPTPMSSQHSMLVLEYADVELVGRTNSLRSAAVSLSDNAVINHVSVSHTLSTAVEIERTSPGLNINGININSSSDVAMRIVTVERNVTLSHINVSGGSTRSAVTMIYKDNNVYPNIDICAFQNYTVRDTIFLEFPTFTSRRSCDIVSISGMHTDTLFMKSWHHFYSKATLTFCTLHKKPVIIIAYICQEVVVAFL